MIAELIDKQDTFEIVRDQVVAILATEVASQMALATAASEDPELWKMRIYEERSNPWEQWLNDQSDLSPVVNVWYENSGFDMSASNIVERQKTNGRFNIDCYAAGVSSDNPAGGHFSADRQAALNVQRAVRLCRNILMSAEYTYLGLRGVVWRRWIENINVFQPQQDVNATPQIVAARVVLAVEFNEYSPQIPLTELELLSVDVSRAEDGQIVIEADYDYTA